MARPRPLMPQSKPTSPSSRAACTRMPRHCWPRPQRTETMEHGLLTNALVYLAAAVVAVPLSKRFGMGTVLGYLLAGILIGPYGLGLISAVEDALHFAEFGVVLL